jgi:hypothetical protein
VCALLYSTLKLDRAERTHQTLRLKAWEVAEVIGLITLPVVTMILAKTLTNGFTCAIARRRSRLLLSVVSEKAAEENE